MRRRNGHSPQDAEDLTQAFFAHLLGHDFLRNVAPEKGRFRSFLLASLKRFMAGQWRKEHALKRGGDASLVRQCMNRPKHAICRSRSSWPTRRVLYERRWALTLLNRVLERLEAEAAGAGKHALFAQLQPFLTGDRNTRTYAKSPGSSG